MEYWRHRRLGKANLMEEDSLKKYYIIKEVAAKLDVAPSCIRFWCETVGIKPKRNKSYNRRFVQADIDQLMVVKKLIDMGFTLRAVKTILAEKQPFIYVHDRLLEAFGIMYD